ncbi:NUDIX domain-containing protein [Thalassoroseus pseudoceratinae]|uniref:NUDIX domain-containing protein n=1 Tax=Thalassoroseus pseudoceratinae TaxID=2713176 RepID=UPI00141F680B|nr:NUDIX hydrolase [Thalassoroseus pseudoceratinae]
MQHGPWKILQQRPIHADPWVTLRQDDVIRPDGEPGTYTVVYVKPGVCVLAVDDEQNVYLTEEFHYGVGRDTLEAVSGGTEANEDTRQTAARELQEEIGVVASSLVKLGTVDPLTSCLVSPTELYLAQGLQFVDPSPEGTEVIRRVKVPLAEAVEKVLIGEITHGPSCVLILKTHLTFTNQ